MSKSNPGAGRERDRNGGGTFAYLSPLSVMALSFGYTVGWGSFCPSGHDIPA